jgi:DNA modification methylase
MKIETTPIEKLIPYARNSRTHSDQQVAQVAASIREFGFTNPVLIDSEDGIIAGHGRVMAARKLGLTEVPCIRLGHLTETQKRAYIIADNKLALNSGWDEEMLGLELADLREADFDLDLIGFDAGEIEAALNPAEITDGLNDPDEVPEPPVDPVTVLGDVWVLGNHRLMCGDSTSIDAVEKLMDGITAESVVTDPPYGINANRQTLGSGKKQFHRGDNWDAERPDIGWLQAFASQIVIWGGNYFADVLPPTNDWLCWHKKNDGLSFSEFELAWTNLGKNCRILSHHWSGEQKVHPTQKPVAVIEWCIGMTTGLVFDPFLGSGTSLIAAEKVGRACYGMELDPQYCDVIINRWQDFTGKKAIHESSGKTFDEMKP